MAADPVGRHLRFLKLRGHSEGSIYARKRALARMTALLPGPLLEATEAHLMAWREGLDLSPGATATYVAHAREFYSWALLEEMVSYNPAACLPVPRVPRLLPRPIPEADLMIAVTAAPDRIRPWLVLAGWAGFRAKEIALLRRPCVLDTARPPVLIVAADATKGRRERVVPMHEFVAEALDRAGLPGSGYLFRRHDGRPGPNKPWLVSQMANAYLHEIGIRETLHQLRHRFGTMTYRATHDLRLVQELMGHERPQTTAGYAAFDNDSAAAAVAALPVPVKIYRRPSG